MRRTIFLVPFVLALGVAPAVLGAKKEPPPPPLPAPDVSLHVEPRPGGKPWRVEVTNRGSVPLRITADVRLIKLTVEPKPAPSASVPLKKGQKPPKPPKSTECVLPSTMRSADRTLVLAPGEKWSEDFDPRLHCLDRVDKLVEGATVTAQLGWSAPKKGLLKAPFAVVPASSGSAEVASAKEIAAPSAVLDANGFPPPPTLNANGSPNGNDVLVASGGAARSLGSGKDVSATIVLRNVSKQSHTVYARPQLVDARVITPRGQIVMCNGFGALPAPIIDFATRLAPNGTWTATVPLDNLCPAGTFDRPGLYLIAPAIHVPAMPDAKDSVSGDFVAVKPQLVRIETGKKSFYDAPPSVAKP